MRALLLLAAAVVLAVAAVERDDLFVLQRVHAEFDGEHDRALELVLTALREVVRADAPLEPAAMEALAPDVRYVFHGRGECNGRAQTLDCLRAEQRERAGGRRTTSVSHQTSAVREGQVQVVRDLEIQYDGTGSRRLLDVYFVHFRGAAIVFLEHMPTVVDPIRLK